MAMPAYARSVTRRRFTVDEYERMGEAGILQEDDRVELLDGEVLEMVPIGPLHAGCVNRLVRLFVGRLGDRAVVTAQNPIRLSGHSEPQPDVALLRPRHDFYATAHAEPDDVLLLVEVSLSSATIDRTVKLPLYAEAGIRQVWIVDLDAIEPAVEVYRRGLGPAYGPPEVLRASDPVAVDAFPDLAVTASDILG